QRPLPAARLGGGQLRALALGRHERPLPRARSARPPVRRKGRGPPQAELVCARAGAGGEGEGGARRAAGPVVDTGLPALTFLGASGKQKSIPTTPAPAPRARPTSPARWRRCRRRPRAAPPAEIPPA